MPIKVTYRVKRSSLPGQEQGHLRVAKKQRTEIPNVFIKTENDNEARSVGQRSGRERNVKDSLRESSSCTSLSSNTRTNQCISNVTGYDCADLIIGTSEGTVVSKLDRKIPPMKTASESECDERDNLQKKYESVSWNFEEEDMVPSSSTYGRSSLTKERLINLVSIGLSHKTKWDTKFEQLQAFKNAYGHTNVTGRSGSLGTWVAKQRTQFRLIGEGKVSPLTDERLSKLNGITFEFKLRTRTYSKASWDTRFQELKEFIKVNGHANVPSRSGSLGIWVSNQRTQFRIFDEGKTSLLTDEQLSKLNGINLFSSCTSLSSNTRTHQCISNMTGDDCADLIIGTSEGTVVSKLDRKIPPMKTASESECDEHDSLQKKKESVSWNFEEEDMVPSSSTYGRSSLTRERVANLVSIGLSHKAKWDTQFEQLQAFKNAHGHTNVRLKSGKLGTWVGEQRKNFRRLGEGKVSPLTDERLSKLNGIKFEFKLQKRTSEALWDTRFQKLKEFIKVKGHANVPWNYGPLGPWVTHQRRYARLFKEGKVSPMTDERLAKLKGIKFEFKR
eukprot:scaffold4843_cov48-Attheya_sp.AAC.2